MNDAPTIAERYQCATVATSLKVETIRNTAPDLLIAAGWSDSLGISLYRLAGEYAQVAQEAKRMETTTDALLVLGKLKSLSRVRADLLGFGQEMAKRWRLGLSEQIVAILVGRCLSAWLEDKCERCNGTGRVGGYDGTVSTICTRCRGSGKAGAELGRGEAEQLFAARLMAEMQQMCASAEDQMRRKVK